MSTVLAGRLLLAPGRAAPLHCERPMVAAAVMRRLAEGRQAALLPALLGSVFALGATAQAQTARRAVRAALGVADDGPADTDSARQLRQATFTEHLQRLALDLPGAGDPGWLRGVPSDCTAAAPFALRLFGQPAADWLHAWRQRGASLLTDWATAHDHPLAHAFAALAPRARALAWPSRPLDWAADPPRAMAALAGALRQDPDFAERPHWQGAPAETGAWQRHGIAHGGPVDAWLRLGARLAEVAALCSGATLAAGALPLGPREGIAWCEMSRGLLVHWARVDRDVGPGDPADSARIAAYRVLAPTEWNFHPQGAFATWLRATAPTPADARLAALALDPCIAVEVAGDA